ncbi:ketopantoate hydroxymethyltransferase [Gonapodya prolifera JEL478]|uniref:3-methyl-2-oxobutanoate hydroxymethyltransferase n=1 Tax=Gonapodya prolifera (strain JEL478) TaxID=1344416 RepID=A0A139A6Q9_GONPJ|nr:ketopantoate hydroxymethyltransferase [Gonapodya prolifera JEL478]|eukprot:KXS12328.1 ketopantoate hydroxymethyltransferase [Gonapodya prolifera JEL478]
MITAHDYPSALFAERAGVECVLVGDSLAMVAMGLSSTTQVTMEAMIHHSLSVSRGLTHPFLIADLPFGSYEVSPAQAVSSSLRMIAEGHVEAVKIEGGWEMEDTVRAITRVGVPVLGHIGLTPQRASQLGGFRVQGRTAEKVLPLLRSALALQRAGCFAIVIECVPPAVGTLLTQRLSIPTIGIGAGNGTSGQVLVQNDMLGMFDGFTPKFCKKFANIAPEAVTALSTYRDAVKARAFPAPEHDYAMEKGEEKKLQEAVERWEREEGSEFDLAWKNDG